MSDLAATLTDPARLAEIVDLDLCAEDLGPELQAVAGDAAETLGMPLGVVNLVLDEAVYAAALHGLEEGWFAEGRGGPVEWMFCRHTVHRAEPYAVEDAAEDPLMCESPVVRFDGVRSYLGVPIVTGEGHAVGAVCVMGLEPRTFTPEDEHALRRLATAAAAILEARRREG